MKNLIKRELTPRMKEIVEFVFANPGLTHGQIAANFGIHKSRISQVLQHDRVLAYYPVLARRMYTGLVPQAIQAQLGLVKQKTNLMVQDKASARVLESINILNSNPVTNINIYAGLTNDDLMRKIDQSKQIPQQSIDAELDDGQ